MSNDERMLPAIRLATAVVKSIDDEMQNQYNLFTILGLPIGCLMSHKVVYRKGIFRLIERSNTDKKAMDINDDPDRSVNAAQRYRQSEMFNVQGAGKYNDESKLPTMFAEYLSVTTKEVSWEGE